MKAPSFAIAVLLGLVSYQSTANAINLQANILRGPRHSTLIRHREEEF